MKNLIEHLISKNVLLLVMCCAVNFAQPAWAHVSLIESFPSAGEVLQESPTHLSLSFSDPIRFVSAEIVDTSGRQVGGVGQPIVKESVLIIPLTDQLPDGSYQINYQLIGAEDSHPIAGSLMFSIKISR